MKASVSFKHLLFLCCVGLQVLSFADVTTANFAADDAFAKSAEIQNDRARVENNIHTQYAPEKVFDQFKKNQPYTSQPEEVKYQSGQGIASASQAAMKSTDSGQAVTAHFEKSPPLSLNLHSPEMLRAKTIKDNAEAIATGKYAGCTKTVNQRTTYTTETCEKSEKKTVSCTRARNPFVYIPEHPQVCSHPVWGGGTPRGAKKIGTYYVHGTHCYHRWFHRICHDTYTAKDITLVDGADANNQCTLGYVFGPGQSTIEAPKNINLTLKTMAWSGINGRLIASAKLSNGVSVAGKDRAVDSQPFILKDESNDAAQLSKQLNITLALSGSSNHQAGLAWVTESKSPKPFIDMDRFVSACDHNTINHYGCTPSGGEICTSKQNETRFIGGVQLTAGCWSYQQNYTCGDSNINTCQPYINEGCSEIGRTCKGGGHNTCLDFNVTYSCPVSKTMGTGIACGDKVFCLSGNCTKHTPSQESAQNFSKAATSLATVSAMGKKVSDLNTQDTNPNNIHIFTGRAMECKETAAGFANCCRGDGWGKDIHLAHCSQEEKDLGKAKQAGRAISVGRYCHNDPLGICTDHHEAYCVFDSRLAQTIQLQGRGAQEHIGFGAPKSPNCRGITPKEMSKLDLSKIDLSFMVNQSAVEQKASGIPDKAIQEIKERVKQMGGNTTSITNDAAIDGSTPDQLKAKAIINARAAQLRGAV